MPTLSTFFGIQIRMYWKDNDKHKSPHFHAYYGEYGAVFLLDGNIFEGSFPKKQKVLIKKWAQMYEDELKNNWLLALAGKQTRKIKPLR
ncbi:MAG: DUF4160 domain-containing protein [Oscillospiraceae bacterium]|nr:DUF4160 domain-containing protein [Oscillospiraceae bacterium]